MGLKFIIPEILIWICILFILFPSSSSSTSRRREVILRCTSSASNSTNDSNAISIIQNSVTVMESILQQVTTRKWGYDSATSSLTQVYGFAQCHSDISDLDCNICFSLGRVKLLTCLPGSSGRVFLDECFIRFDRYNFFNETVDDRYDSVSCSEPPAALRDKNSSFHIEFKNELAETIHNLTETVIKNGTFAVVVGPIYALAQCWNTLDSEQCRTCLNRAGSKLLECAPATEGRAMFTGCYMRYCTEKFFSNESGSSSRRWSKTGIIIAINVVFLLLAALGAFIGYQRLSKKKEVQSNLSHLPGWSNLNFKYEVLEKATDFFNDTRKLGQGGAGSVYKGVLPDGKIVAVKRLVYNTRQWVDQFFNEVNLVSGIQHKNLVQLLGCSIEGPESLLVFEYVPNRSLDQILFSDNPMNKLSWTQRFSIITGTAEGLAYLHGGSGVKIIHRDIKASNVLLDKNLCPKIGDFGLARGAELENSHISTGIAGTLGYMAPEYLVRGQLTEKADVYAFGVLVLEIACGKKNSVFSQGSSSILHSVWKHYKSKTLTETIDPSLKDSFLEEEAAIVLQIGLLCTQASATLRPSMVEVVRMLTVKECEVPCPKQPPFLNASVLSSSDSAASSLTKVSLLENSVTAHPIDAISKQISSDNQHSHTTGSSSTCFKRSSEIGPSEPR